MLRTSSTKRHSSASHFSWIGTALFTGFLWMTIMSLRTYAEDPCAEKTSTATPAPTPPVFGVMSDTYDDDEQRAAMPIARQQDTTTCQGVVVSCHIMTLLAEWVFACFTILLMHSQFMELRESHDDHHEGKHHDTVLDPSHDRVHRLLDSPCGALLMLLIYAFLGGLCVVDTVGLTYTVTQVHPDVHDVCWGAFTVVTACAFAVVFVGACWCGGGFCAPRRSVIVLGGVPTVSSL